jgi:hypothetical protein
MDDPFFDVLPNFIRYNRFTMKRWLLNNCKDYVPVSIETKETELMAELKIEVDKLAEVYVDERDKAMEAINEERELRVAVVCLTDLGYLGPASL